MSISWLGILMLVCWLLTLLGGVGVHVLSHFDGRKLEAYCRLKRRPEKFGAILDLYEDACTSAEYLLQFGLILGSLAAGAWLYGTSDVSLDAGVLSATSGGAAIFGWVLGWLLLLTLAGLWLPRIVARYSSSLFLYHSWWLWRRLVSVTAPISGLGEVFSWVGHRLSDEPDDEDHEEEILEDEIRTMVAAGQREGVFSPGVQEMIQGVMELDDVDVAKIMTPRGRVDAIDISLPWNLVVQQVLDCGRTRIPVYRGTLDKIEGVLFVKDLLSTLAHQAEATLTPRLEDILRKPWFIPGNKRVDELLQMFLHNRNHMAIVIDEYQQLVGVVTIEDALEEIVGEIADELDVDEDSGLYYDADTHRIEAEGKVPVESIGELLGVALPESDEYDTVGGLIIHRLMEIPKIGTEVELNGIRITVLKASKRMIQRVRLEVVDV